MYCTPVETRKAIKRHQCTYCGQHIQIGETYKRWASYDGGEAFTNKMHPECLADGESEGYGGEFEYLAYSNERPTAQLETSQ